MGVIFRQAAKSATVTYAGIGVGGLTMLYLFPKFLDVSEVGLIKTLVDMAGVISPFVIFGTGNVVRRYFHDFSKDGKDGGLIITNLWLLLIFTGLGVGTYIGISDWIISFFIEKSPLVSEYVYVPLYCGILLAYFFFFRSVSVVFLRTTVPTALNNTLNRVLVALLILVNGLTPFLSQRNLVLSYLNFFFLVPTIGAILYAFKLLHDQLLWPSIATSIRIVKKTILYNLALISSALSGVLIQIIDSLMLSSKAGLETTGIYSISFYLVSVISIPKRTIAEISFPVLRKAIINDQMDNVLDIYRKSSASQFLFGIFIFSVIWPNIDSVFELMPNGDTYAQGKYVVLFIGIGVLFDLITGVNRQIIEASSFYGYNLAVNVLLSVSAIGLNLWLIPVYGLNGAAIASMISLILTNMTLLVIVYLKMRILPFSRKTIRMFFALLPLLLLSVLNINTEYAVLNIFVNTVIVCLFFYIVIPKLDLSSDFDNLAQKLMNLFKF